MNIAQDESGDIEVVNGRLVLVGAQFGTQLREIEEKVEQRLRTFFGEHFLDRSLGIPYFEDIFTKPARMSVIEPLLVNEILQTPGVVRLLEFNLDLNKTDRVLFFTALRIQATSGVIEFSELELGV